MSATTIKNNLLEEFAREIDEEVTSRLVTAFDEAIQNENTDPSAAVLDEAIKILKERIDEITER